VSLTCSVSAPTGATAPPQCSVPASQSSVTVSGNAPVVASVSITTTGAVARNAPGGPLRRGGSGRAAGLAMAGVLLLLAGRRRNGALLLLLVMLAGTFAIAACGSSGGGASAASSAATAAGSYTVTVTASASGVQPVSAQIGLTIQ
jgi:hypothetical protein